MKSFTKKYKSYNPKCPYNDLTIEEAFETELEIWKRLSGNEHFPKLLEFDEKNHTITLEHCGDSLDRIKSLKIDNLDEQIDSIVRCLQKYKIVHLDMHDSGKNICYKNNKIYLIDFDIAVIDGNPRNEKLKSLFEKYEENNFKKTIKRIVSKK